MPNTSIKTLQSYLQENDLEAFLVLERLNRQYVSGFTGSAGAVLVSKKTAQLFVDDRYTIRARRESPLPVKRIAGLKLRAGSKVAVEDKISLKEFQGLKRRHRGVKWVVAHDVIENLRAVKTPREIAAIRKAQRIVDKVFLHLRAYVKEGMREIEIAQELERFSVKTGADGQAFEAIVASGPNAAAPHHFSGNDRVRKNNFLLMDFGVLVSGYHSDFTRTLFLGKPSKKQEKVYNTVLEAQREAISLVKSGNRAAAVDGAARGHIKRKGFGRYFTHNTGHGVGLEIHELPNFSETSPDMLHENMIVTVEPGIYLGGWGGVRIEDMVLVGEKKGSELSKAPKDFKSMIIK